MKKLKQIDCGDWHRGWGYGYTLHGKLKITGPNTFEWNGGSSGRHGQKWWSGGFVKYVLDKDRVRVVDSLHTTYGPHRQDLITAMNTLLASNGLSKIPEDIQIVKE